MSFQVFKSSLSTGASCLFKISAIVILLAGCASFKKQQALSDLGLVKYQPDSYESLMDYSGSASSEEYELCVKGIDKLRYKFYSLTYKSGDLNIKAIVGLPPDFDPEKKYPLLVSNRGGNRNFGYLSACYLRMKQAFAETIPGAILVASQFRGSHGSDGEDEFGGKDVDDVINLIEWTKKAKFIDPERHYLAGWSRGGMMSYLLLKRQIKFKAAAIVAGTADLINMEKVRPEMASGVHQELIPNYSTQRIKVLKERSAIYWPEKINIPLLIIHGSDDWRVSVKDSRKMDQLLTKHKKVHKYIEYPGEGHDLDNKYWDALDEIEAWFKLY